jgi:hypothetical protein
VLQPLGIHESAVEAYSMTEFVSAESVGETKDPNVVRVLVGIPHEGMTGSEAYVDRLAMFKHLGHLEERGKLLKESPRFEFFQKTCGRMHVHVARDEMAKSALVSNCDYLFMIDDDMTAPIDLFEKLYANQKDIVAPLAFTRNFPHKPVMYACREGWDPVAQCHQFTNYAVMKYPKDKLVECDAVGFGAVLIKTECFRKMPQPWFMNPNKTGEDINFCYEAKKYEFRTFMDTRIKLGHISHPLIITEEYVQNQWKAFGMEVDKRYGTPEKMTNSQEPILTLGE